MQCKLFDLAAFGDGKALRFDRSIGTGGALEARAMLRTAVFLDASNIEQSWTNWVHRLAGDYGLRETLSPWDSVFVYAGESSDDHGGIMDFGVHCYQPEKQKGISFVKSLISSVSSKSPQRGDEMSKALPADFYSVLLTLWATNSRKLIACHLGSVIAILDDNRRYRCAFPMLGSTFHLHHTEQKEHLNWYLFALFVFQFMSCKNVITRTEEPYRPQMPRGLRNKSPKIKYHTLAISNTLVKRDGHEGTGEQPGVSKHVCRGNFAHYTEDKPLFGKYVGTFWRPMHIKGSAKHGIVGKDYTMQATD